MRFSQASLIVSEGDVEDELNTLLPKGVSVHGLRLLDWGAEGDLSTGFGTAAVRVSCAMDDGRMRMDVKAAWWVPIPAALLGQIVRRVVEEVPGVEVDGVSVWLDLGALIAEHASADSWTVQLGEHEWVIVAKGVTVSREAMAPGTP